MALRELEVLWPAPQLAQLAAGTLDQPRPVSVGGKQLRRAGEVVIGAIQVAAVGSDLGAQQQ